MPTNKPRVIMVVGDEFQDSSPTEEMIERQFSKQGFENPEQDALENRLQMLEMMSNGHDNSCEMANLRINIKNTRRKRKKSPKRGSKSPSKRGGKKQKKSRKSN